MTGPALALAATGSGVSSMLLNLHPMAALKLGFGAVLLFGALATPLVLQRRALVNLREQNVSLRQQVDQLAQLEANNQRLSNLLANTTTTRALTPDELSELLRLRSDVGLLRQMTNRPETARRVAEPAESADSSARPQFFYVGGAAVRLPNRQVLIPGTTLTAAIQQAGGLLEGADKTKVKFTHEGNEVILDLKAIEQGTVPDPQILPDDKVFVPMIGSNEP
jgi:hypothetical protein